MYSGSDKNKEKPGNGQSVLERTACERMIKAVVVDVGYLGRTAPEEANGFG